MFLPNQFKMAATVIAICCFAGLALFGTNLYFPFPFVTLIKQQNSHEFINSEPTWNQGCVLPKLEPEPRRFQKGPVDCSNQGGAISVSAFEGAFLKIEINGDYKFTDGSIRCSYVDVLRIDDFTTKLSPDSRFLTFLTPNQKTSVVSCPSQAVKLRCNDSQSELFNSVVRCFPPVANLTTDRNVTAYPGPFSERLNILMFGFDSMSRVSWLEQLQKTTKFVDEELGGVTFEGYNVVGDGTTAALMALFTGFMEEELPEARRGFEGAKQLDAFPFLFRQLREQGDYVTLWDEDFGHIGTFQMRLEGWKEPPVDYYERVFQLEFGWPRQCFGTMTGFEEMFRQFRHLFAVYPDPRRKFALIFNSVFTHTSSVESSQEAYRVDASLENELRWLLDHGHLNESVLILFADHGTRYGASRVTYRGKLEERFPYLSIVTPRWFQAKYKQEMANFVAASKQLTTPFDLHATLLDIAGLPMEPGTPSRGLSFFSPIPADRTCKDAGILPHWCTCLQGKDIDLDHQLVNRSLSEFENYVNNELLGSFITLGNCSTVTALRPSSAHLLDLRPEVAQFVKTTDDFGREPKLTNDMSKDYKVNLQVAFATEPGDGLWEVSFAWNLADDRIEVLPKQISRINKYGSAPACIQNTHPHLRQYCVCL